MHICSFIRLGLFAGISLLTVSAQSQDSAYAERLGFPKGARVVVLHIDDIGNSIDANLAAMEAMTKGVATSCSVMMPCAWVPGFLHFLQEHPEIDAGLHLTLTSEWNDYRWGPLAGKPAVPGLVDSQGAMWKSVKDVVQHATAEEVDREIRAQLDRALTAGFRPTHLDSHMGTLFETPAFISKYVGLGIEKRIPVMFPGGHNTLIAQQLNATAAQAGMARAVGRTLWQAGLPVIDDLHNESYDLHMPKGLKPKTRLLKKYKTRYYMDVLRAVKPGITYVIMHCIKLTDEFSYISSSWAVRHGDFLAMMNPALRRFIEQEGIILTTMRELMERRRQRS